MLGAKRRIWDWRAPSSKILMVTVPTGFSKEIRQFCMAAEKGNLHTNHCLLILQHTPPIPILEASVAPNQ